MFWIVIFWLWIPGRLIGWHTDYIHLKRLAFVIIVYMVWRPYFAFDLARKFHLSRRGQMEKRKAEKILNNKIKEQTGYSIPTFMHKVKTGSRSGSDYSCFYHDTLTAHDLGYWIRLATFRWGPIIFTRHIKHQVVAKCSLLTMIIAIPCAVVINFIRLLLILVIPLLS